jgi:hypothetical protein
MLRAMHGGVRLAARRYVDFRLLAGALCQGR